MELENIESIFITYKQHLSALQFFAEEGVFSEMSVMTEQERDEEISSIVLAAPPLNGLPHGQGFKTSSTERAVLMMNPTQQQYNKTIQQHQFMVRLYEAIWRILNDRERWFIEYYYHQGNTLTDLPKLHQSPFALASRSTMSNFRKKVLKKAQDFVSQLSEA